MERMPSSCRLCMACGLQSHLHVLCPVGIVSMVKPLRVHPTSARRCQASSSAFRQYGNVLCRLPRRWTRISEDPLQGRQRYLNAHLEETRQKLLMRPGQRRVAALVGQEGAGGQQQRLDGARRATSAPPAAGGPPPAPPAARPACCCGCTGTARCSRPSKDHLRASRQPARLLRSLPSYSVTLPDTLGTQSKLASGSNAVPDCTASAHIVLAEGPHQQRQVCLCLLQA